MDSKKIAVLGSGPMGMAVAYQLVIDGHRPVVFEADDRVGGMTASFDFDGFQIERFYHFHCVSDRAFLEILDELNLQQKLHWVEARMGYYYLGKIMPWGNPLALLKFSGLSYISKFRFGLHAFLSTRRKNWRPLDNVKAIPWIKFWVGEEAYEVLWKTLFTHKFYDYAETISAAWIWSRIRRIGNSRYDLFREKLGYLAGGSETLMTSMKEFIESRGGEFRLSSPVHRVVIEKGQIEGIRVNNAYEAFDTVVSTVPLPYLPRLIPDLPENILLRYREVKNIAVVCVIAKLKKPATEHFWLNINDPEMDIPGLIEYTNLRPMDHHVVYVPFYLPAEHSKYQDPDQVFKNKVKLFLKMINPTLKDGDFIAMHTSRYRYAQPICPPGHLDRLPPFDLPVKGLWAADTSYYYPQDRGISESIEFGRMLAKKVIA